MAQRKLTACVAVIETAINDTRSDPSLLQPAGDPVTWTTRGTSRLEGSTTLQGLHIPVQALHQRARRTMRRRIGVSRRSRACEFSSCLGEQHLKLIVGDHATHRVQPLPQHRLNVAVIQPRVRPHPLYDAGDLILARSAQGPVHDRKCMHFLLLHGRRTSFRLESQASPSCGGRAAMISSSRRNPGSTRVGTTASVAPGRWVTYRDRTAT
jgi:hypothetical protein